jgi:hypothetical protein
MPMYYFHLFDDVAVRDPDGTDLIDVAAARAHAVGVARELTFKSPGMMRQGWSEWTMRVHDEDDTELFSLQLDDFEPGTP